MNPLDYVHIPEFEEFVRPPSNKLCQIIDATRLKVEILWWFKHASKEFSEWKFSETLLIDGEFSLIIRYERIVKNKQWKVEHQYRPVCSIGYDMDDTWTVVINQVQGSKDKYVAFRVYSSFNTNAYTLKLLEESFLKKGIPVYMRDFPKGVEDASYTSKSIERYEVLRSALIGLNTKYFGALEKA